MSDRERELELEIALLHDEVKQWKHNYEQALKDVALVTEAFNRRLEKEAKP